MTKYCAWCRGRLLVWAGIAWIRGPAREDLILVWICHGDVVSLTRLKVYCSKAVVSIHPIQFRTEGGRKQCRVMSCQQQARNRFFVPQVELPIIAHVGHCEGVIDSAS